MLSSPVIYIGAFVAALAMTFVFTPLALRVALKRQLLDKPHGYKAQATAVPYLGGLAIVASFAIVVLVGGFLRPLATFTNQLPMIVGVAVAFGVLGLIDDIKGTHPAFRFALEVIAACGLFAAGVRVEIFSLMWPDLLLTVVWVVGITNAFNLLDNIDGLSAGIAAIASFFFFVIAALNDQILVAALAIALTGCALGFLRHNFHPAKIYMGDAGSLFLGFMLSVLGIKLRFEGDVQVTFIVPILVLGVAILDTFLVVSTRLIHRMNPFAGGRDHTSHRLVFVGIPVPIAVGLIYFAAAALGWLALCVSRVDTTTAYMLSGFAVMTGLGLLVGLSRVPVYENSKRRRMMIVEVKTHEEEPVESAAQLSKASH